MPNAARRVAWCFTLPQKHLDEQALYSTLASMCKYAVVGLETAPTTGMLHYQGYFRLKKRLTLNQIKEKLCPEIHLEMARGSSTQNRDYCTKENTLFEVGSCPSQGKSHALQEIIDDFHLSWEELLDKYKGSSTFCLRYDSLERWYQLHCQRELPSPNPYDTCAKPLWVDKLHDDLIKQPLRVIDWVWSDEGNVGKTCFCHYLMHLYKEQVFYCPGARMADFAHAYNSQQWVIFDIPRDKQDYLQYSILESVANGVLFSSKYSSRIKKFPKPIILVVANFYADITKISQDRIRTMKLFAD